VKNVTAKFWADASVAIALDLIAAALGPAMDSALNATFTSITSSPK
jgi:hypothetical protein